MMWSGLQMRSLVGVDCGLPDSSFPSHRRVFLNFSCHLPDRLPLGFEIAADPSFVLPPNASRPFDG